MKTEIVSYLRAPVSRGRAFAALAVCGGGIFILADTLLRRADHTIKDQAERLAIYSETTKFLMEEADGQTLAELDDHLDYWRVVRGMPVDKS